MSLILAIEPDRSQASHLDALARNHLHTELLVVDSATHAIDKLAERVPDVILTSMLLSPREDAALSDRLRDLGAAAAHIQTLTIPIFSVDQPAVQKKWGLGGLLNKRRAKAPDHGGCEPAAFAEQIALYLERAALERGLTGNSALVQGADVDVCAVVDATSSAMPSALAAEAPTALPTEAGTDEDTEAIGESLIDQPAFDVAAWDDSALDGADVEESLSVEVPALAIEEQVSCDAVGAPEDASDADVPFFNLELEWLDDAPSGRTVADDVVAAMQVSDRASVATATSAPLGPQVLGASLDEEAAQVDRSEAAQYDPFATFGSDHAETANGVPLDTPDGHSAQATMELEWLAEEAIGGDLLEARNEGTDAALGQQGSGIGDQGSGIRVACKADDLDVDLTMLSRFIDESRLGQDPAYEMEVASSESSREGTRQESALPKAADAAAVAAPPAPEPPLTVVSGAEVRARSKLRSLLDFEKHVAERISRRRAEKAAAQAKAEVATARKPAQDEWGLFDPDQCGFSALIERLEEVSTEETAQSERADDRFRIIS